MINYLALIVALCVSAVSGFYSIVGLATIFSAAFIPVVCMGIVLELGKLVTATWLHINWNKTSILLKSYLTVCVIILMFITSLGIFGFLSKAHIEQTLKLNTGTAEEIKIIDTKILFETKVVEDLDKQIGQIDKAIDVMVNTKGQANNSLKAADTQRKTRDNLLKTKKEHTDKISQLTQEKIKLQSEIKKIEAEVGPLKYVAEIIYDKPDENHLEKAVRWVIILLIFVFDPLAVLLLIASTSKIHEKSIRRPGRPLGSKNKIEIERKNLMSL